jgi:hypothetical protein
MQLSAVLLQKEKPARPVHLDLFGKGEDLYFRLTGEGGRDLVLRVNRQALLAALGLGERRDPAPPGLETPAWRFGADDLPDNIEPVRGHEITMADLRPGDDAHNWRLIARRFPWLFAKEYSFKQAVKYAETLAALPAGEGPEAGPIEADLEKCLPYLDDLTRKDGSLNQAAIARILGGKNAGAFHYDRVLPVVERLEQYLVEDSTTTTTTTGLTSGEPARKRGARPAA